ncbi:MAG: VWA domain-containing protein [Candidatus Omnitrophota bacterium]
MLLRNPLLLALLPLAAAVLFYAQRKNTRSAIKFTSGSLLKGLPDSFKLKLAKNLFFLRLASCVLIIIALTRPQSPLSDSRIQSEGIDIVLAIDCSTSMLAEDFKLGGRRQNRLEAVRDVVKDFVRGRANDRLGLAAFAGGAYTACPLTLDHGWLLENLERVKTGLIEDGTAIGLGLVCALNSLKSTKAKSKVVILLTDGRNNAGGISPLTAAEAARALKIKVYTIGAGTKGSAPYPVKDFFGNTAYQLMEVDIDEDVLKEIAAKTEGKYFRATDTESLRQIYKEIDRLEKTVIEDKGYREYKELFPLFLIPGLILLFTEIILSNTFLRKIP